MGVRGSESRSRKGLFPIGGVRRRLELGQSRLRTKLQELERPDNPQLDLPLPADRAGKVDSRQVPHLVQAAGGRGFDHNRPPFAGERLRQRDVDLLHIFPGVRPEGEGNVGTSDRFDPHSRRDGERKRRQGPGEDVERELGLDLELFGTDDVPGVLVVIDRGPGRRARLAIDPQPASRLAAQVNLPHDFAVSRRRDRI